MGSMLYLVRDLCLLKGAKMTLYNSTLLSILFYTSESRICNEEPKSELNTKGMRYLNM